MLGDNWVAVQQERPVLPRLIWVTQFYAKDEADALDVKILDRHHLLCIAFLEYPRRVERTTIEIP